MFTSTFPFSDSVFLQELESLKDLLHSYVGTCSSYHFGYRGSRHYLCIFTSMPVRATHLMHEIAERTNRTIHATVLVHPPKHLKTKEGSQEYFFDQVLRKGRRLFLDTMHVPYVLNHSPKRDLESDMRYWQQRVAVAQFYLLAAKEHPHVSVTGCKIALLNTACVHLATGLLRVCLGYSPREFGLHYLLQLCLYFTAIPESLMGLSCAKAQHRYKLLCVPAGLLLHRVDLDADEADFIALVQDCEHFLERALLLVATMNKTEPFTLLYYEK